MSFFELAAKIYIPVAKAINSYHPPGMDNAVVAHSNSHMINIFAIIGKKDQISGLCIKKAARYMFTTLQLHPGVSWQ